VIDEGEKTNWETEGNESINLKLTLKKEGEMM
jgi:hypothetical protein